MRIDLSAIDRDFFFVRESSHPTIGPLVQIAPQKNKHRWAPDEVHLRSLLTRPDGTIVSSGFPKFFNVGEVPEDDAITTEAVNSGRAWFSEKLDGSLIIRDVIGGEVLIRTRGSTRVTGDRGERLSHLIARCYPALLDPTILAGRSLLFEHLSPHPDDRIILQYPLPKLAALGWMQHHTDRLPAFHGDPDTVAELSVAVSVPAVGAQVLPADLDAVMAKVWGWEDFEGVVVRAQRPDGSTHLAKLKTLSYLKSHSVKGHFNAERLRRFCWAEGITTRDGLIAALSAQGVDWEVLHFLEAPLMAWLAHRADVDRRIAAFSPAVTALADLPSMGDKARTLKGVCANEPDFADLFGLGMARLKGLPEAESIGALHMQLSLSQFRQFTREGLAAARDLSPRMSSG
ncbi:MAG: hypothetical protein ACI8RZ_002332 [Myxococcota bacterium]|jgi:hypothetical protein